MARSARGSLWEPWHEAQLAECAPTECRPASLFGAWHVVHAGGLVTPFGPWGVWHDAQPPFGSAPWCCFDFSAWQLVHFACSSSEPECESWQLVQMACPGNVDAVSFA